MHFVTTAAMSGIHGVWTWALMFGVKCDTTVCSLVTHWWFIHNNLFLFAFFFYYWYSCCFFLRYNVNLCEWMLSSSLQRTKKQQQPEHVSKIQYLHFIISQSLSLVTLHKSQPCTSLQVLLCIAGRVWNSTKGMVKPNPSIILKEPVIK